MELVLQKTTRYLVTYYSDMEEGQGAKDGQNGTPSLNLSSPPSPHLSLITCVSSDTLSMV
jgi:hypothetical protein